MENKEKERAKEFAAALCRYAGRDEAFAADFWDRLLAAEEIYEEFCHYMENQQFSCKTSIGGYTVVDVLVWQIDHFKAEMDRSDPGLKNNGDKMLLNAFDVFLKMRKEPEKYVRAMREETGTDYPDKFR